MSQADVVRSTDSTVCVCVCVSVRRSKYDILMESTSNLLSELPDKTGIMMKLREQLVTTVLLIIKSSLR